MAPNLGTTNVFLGIIAAVSLLEALAVIAVVLGGSLIYRRLTHLLRSIEEREVAPAVARINAILDDVKDVTGTVSQETGRIDRLLDWLVDGVGRKRQRTNGEQSTRVM